MSLKTEQERVMRVYIEQIAALGAICVYQKTRSFDGWHQTVGYIEYIEDIMDKVLHLSFACGRLDMTSRKGLDSE